MTIEIKTIDFDRSEVADQLWELEELYGVPSHQRHVPFMRRRWRFPFLRLELEETADWQRWEYLYTVWREMGEAHDPPSHPDPAGLPGVVQG